MNSDINININTNDIDTENIVSNNKNSTIIDNNDTNDTNVDEEDMNVDEDEIIDCDDFFKFRCPHCKINIVVMKNEINCKIFRCGQYMCDGRSIEPHLPKKSCDILRDGGEIYGCARPFMFDGKIITICDYI